ncbi:MAG: transcriptional repressor [Rhodospirillaceae bacterium]|jgi:Fur family transcriptional regulator, zinc uptake regulator|nr:transcriptional repressor [Rhodospirillaceae bacterium]
MKQRTKRRAFPREGHDHADCVASALDAAETRCADRGARLTPLRRRVLEIVWRGHAPVRAYEVLDRLREDGAGAAAPPTVYRALDFLMEHGLVHRIESLNAFIGCDHPDEAHSGQFLICRDCGLVAELDDAEISGVLARKARALGFVDERATVELRGLCPECRGGRG